MKKHTKIWLITAAVFFTVGAIIFVGALAAVDFDFTKLSTAKFQTSTYELIGDFSHISVDVETANVTFVPSDSGVCKVVCLEEEKVTHFAEIKDGVLIISVADGRRWYEHIGIGFVSPKVTVYLPEGVYASLSVKSETGNVNIPDAFTFESVTVKATTGNITLCSPQAETVNLSVKTGNIKMTDAKVGNLTVKSSTGNIYLTNVIAEGALNIKSSTGNVKLNGCDGAEITVKTSTGNVKGTLISEKIFITDTSTGNVKVPSTNSGGTCKITTSTGNIKIEIGSAA